jgi:TIR domain
MAGRNRFFARGGTSLMEKAGRASAEACVFISHQYADLALATTVGNQLKALEVDIWLDAEDVATQRAVECGDQRKLAEAIEWGLSNCTHLLALISPRTKGSWWVPYEIGSVRGRSKQLALFVHKDVSDLPAYLTFGKKILDQIDFYAWATEVSSNTSLTENKANLQKSASLNPLAHLLPPVRVG